MEVLLTWAKELRKSATDKSDLELREDLVCRMCNEIAISLGNDEYGNTRRSSASLFTRHPIHFWL